MEPLRFWKREGGTFEASKIKNHVQISMNFLCHFRFLLVNQVGKCLRTIVWRSLAASAQEPTPANAKA